jgi:hypothetical protein
LLDAAIAATRENWTTFTCPDCGKKHRAQVHVPDVRARVGAIEVLLREGLGRPAQAEEVVGPDLPANADAVARMSWADTQHLAALLFVDEVESVLTTSPTNSKPSSPTKTPNKPKNSSACSSKTSKYTTAAGSSPPTGFRRRFAQHLLRWAVLGSNQ